jgi:competence protein ComGC
MPNEFVGQNGAVIKQSSTIEVTGCSGAISVVSSKVNKRTLTVSVYVPAAGKLTVSGRGLKPASKSAAGRETLTLTLTQKKAGKLKTKIKLTFTPSKGKEQAKTVKETFRK